MNAAYDAVDAAIREVEALRAAVRKGKNRQVRGQDECARVKATAYSWFKGHRPQDVESGTLDEADSLFKQLLAAAERNTPRARYDDLLKTLKSRLVQARESFIDLHTGRTPVVSPPPDFSPLIPDPRMQAILADRWRETQRCIGAGAHLAASVMVGGLLEGLLLARVNAMSNKGPLFQTKAAPRDNTRKPQPLQKWMLADFLSVAHEMGWIRSSAHSVGGVVRDYRNYIHPAKQLSHGVVVVEVDTQLIWAVFVEIARQLVDSA